MAGKVYSERFVYTETAGAVAVYTVPEGLRAVVRNIVATNSGIVTNYFIVKAHGIIVGLWEFRAEEFQVSMDLRQVVYGGETISAQGGLEGIAVMVSGYLFADPLHAEGPPQGVQTKPTPPPDPWHP